MATEAERRRLVDLARAMQDDQRYGHLTNPVILGVLIAVDLLSHPRGTFGPAPNPRSSTHGRTHRT